MITAPDTAPLTDWIGRADTAHGKVDAQMAVMVHSTLGSAPRCPVPGDILPRLWHWYAFPADVPMAQLARDGHPKLGGFLPPVPLERRMWAAGKLEFHEDLHVGEALTRHSRIDAVTEKQGAAGPMVFVTVAHEIRGEAGLAITERQDIVYLNIADPFTPPPKKPAPVSDLAFERTVPISEALLFRYSAITFNAHRIHYDLAYSQNVEKYPGLVVHGPMQANFLIAAATDWAGAPPKKFAFRGVHPMFHDSNVSLRGWRGEGGGLDMCTAADAGHQGMTAKATWEES